MELGIWKIHFQQIYDKRNTGRNKVLLAFVVVKETTVKEGEN